MSIKYSDLVFSEPVPLASWEAPVRAGVYAILTPDARCKPRPFSVIYFGESGNMSERGFLDAHHKCGDWRRVAQSDAKLFIATYPMPYSTPEQRRAVEAALITNYNPVCNG